VRPLVMATLRFIQLSLPLSPLKPMGQSRRGAPHLLEAQRPPLILRIKEKIALSVLSEAFLAVTVYRVRALTSVGVPLMVQVALSILKPLKPMGQSRRGAPHLLEAQRPPLILRILQVQTK
jgi:hypothetical protein